MPTRRHLPAGVDGTAHHVRVGRRDDVGHYPAAVDFTVSDDRSLHARSITTDTGWKISLDRAQKQFCLHNARNGDLVLHRDRNQVYPVCGERL